MKLISSIQNAHLPTVTVEPGFVVVCQFSSVGVVAERRFLDVELDQYIHDVGLLMERLCVFFVEWSSVRPFIVTGKQSVVS